MQSFIQKYINKKKLDTSFLDLEILYIGQSFGVKQPRTPFDRLKSHETLQKIYSEIMTKNIDSEIWVALLSFEEILYMISHQDNGYTMQEIEDDWEKRGSVICNKGITAQQKINFTEAALIKYFDPIYNENFKDSFPSPTHKTYSECYKLDINSVIVELGTQDIIECKFYSDKVPKQERHHIHFTLHSEKERKNMFDFSE